MKTIFGFDIGTTSIGWAVIRVSDEVDKGSIIALGVRIFPEARDPDGTPLNQQRRLARHIRRQVSRRRGRRRDLNSFLAEHGFLPTFGGPEWADAMALDPYQLRHQGLARELSAYELGRALYHLSKRRHFRGRDLEEVGAEETKEKADEKEAKSAREKLVKALKDTGQTLGGYLSSLPPGERKRGHHALRENVLSEFRVLIDKQSEFNPQLRDPIFVACLEETIFAQRPVFWRENTLGQCRLMPGAELAPKASWLSCQRRMLEAVNNIEIAGGNRRPLLPEERKALLDVLQTQASMSWGGVRKALAPIFKARGETTTKLRFNLEEGGSTKLEGNLLEAKLAAIFGQAWVDHPHKQAIRDAASDRLRASDYSKVGKRIVILRENERQARRKAAAESFARDFGASPSQVAMLEELTFPSAWDKFSSQAIRALLPELEHGTRLGALLVGPEWADWRDAHFPAREQPTGEILDRLPSPQDKEEAARLRDVRNPTVVRVLNELRKVVNNLIRVHGKPDLVRVELARDVGLSKAEREKKSSDMRRQEKRRNEATADLRANNISQPTPRDIEAWLLWKECGERDPYSGAHISFDALFRNNEFEVEHIFPRSLSLDNSFANKTLCRRDLNQLKGQRLPFEAFGHDEDQWNAIKNRIVKMTASKGGVGMSRGKAKRFLATSIPDGFVARQLNDTGYAARQAVASLKRLWPDLGPQAPVNVQTVNGKVTAYIRRLWRLNNILADDGEKTRADHRHHAIDALVVACSDPGVTQRLSRYWQEIDGPKGAAGKPVFSPPWATLREEATQKVTDVIVSHRVRKKVSGPLHKGTIYGPTDLSEKSGKKTYDLFSVRKPLGSLSKGELEDIRDARVRQIVNDWVLERGGDPKKAFPPFPRLDPDGPEIRKARILIKQQKSLMAPVTTGFADLGSNHHIAIYRNAVGKAEFEVVSLFEAARRLSAREPVVRRERENATFVMSLSQGDALSMQIGDSAGIWIVCSIWSGGQVVLELAHDAAHATTTRPTANTLLTQAARKISIDPIGRIKHSGD